MARFMTRRLPAGVLLVLLTAYTASAQRSIAQQRFNLTGSWQDDRGRMIFIRQVDNSICWYADLRPSGHEVFCGAIDRNVVAGEWMDLPGGRQQTNGQLTLRVESNNRIVKVRSVPRYDSSTWIRDNSRDNPRITTNEGPIPIGPAAESGWEAIAGTARDIGVGNDGTVWIISNERTQGGYTIYTRNRNQWIRVDGGAVRLDVDGQGIPWIVNSEGVIYRRDRNQWERLPGSAVDIGAGADGDVWTIGTNPVPGGFGIFRWTGRGWATMDGGAMRIDVDGRGTPWIVNAEGLIFRRDRNQWEKLPGTARDISINAAGEAWVVGTDEVAGGYGLFRWAGNNWARIEGGATQLSVGGNGDVWVVNASGQIYRWRR